MQSSRSIHTTLQRDILGGIKVPHLTAAPVLYREADGTFYLASFCIPYKAADIRKGVADRPTTWCLCDLESGAVLERFETNDREFSHAPYRRKYAVCSDRRNWADASWTAWFDAAFDELDAVREELLAKGTFNETLYADYLERIVAGVPHDYQRFYFDLSVPVPRPFFPQADVVTGDADGTCLVRWCGKDYLRFREDGRAALCPVNANERDAIVKDPSGIKVVLAAHETNAGADWNIDVLRDKAIRTYLTDGLSFTGLAVDHVFEELHTRPAVKAELAETLIDGAFPTNSLNIGGVTAEDLWKEGGSALEAYEELMHRLEKKERKEQRAKERAERKTKQAAEPAQVEAVSRKERTIRRTQRPRKPSLESLFI
jgi:hypothetical protein